MLWDVKGTERTPAAVGAELSHYKTMRRLSVESINRRRAPSHCIFPWVWVVKTCIYNIDRKVCIRCMHIKVYVYIHI